LPNRRKTRYSKEYPTQARALAEWIGLAAAASEPSGIPPIYNRGTK